MPYISPAGLSRLAAHRYQAGEYSVLDGLMNPLWARVADSLPLWLAPNAITLVGTLAMVSTLVVAESTAAPSGDGMGLPPWSHAFIAAALLFYQTADAVDGKQARRTGSSSPLGQLFDHGCDALVAAIQAVNLAYALELGGTWLGDCMLHVGVLAFFVGQVCVCVCVCVCVWGGGGGWGWGEGAREGARARARVQRRACEGGGGAVKARVAQAAEGARGRLAEC